MNAQLSLFKTLHCSYCGSVITPHPRNPFLLFGFLDAATGQHICYRRKKCRKTHEANKESSKTKTPLIIQQ